MVRPLRCQASDALSLWKRQFFSDAVSVISCVYLHCDWKQMTLLVGSVGRKKLMLLVLLIPGLLCYFENWCLHFPLNYLFVSCLFPRKLPCQKHLIFGLSDRVMCRNVPRCKTRSYFWCTYLKLQPRKAERKRWGQIKYQKTIKTTEPILSKTYTPRPGFWLSCMNSLLQCRR